MLAAGRQVRPRGRARAGVADVEGPARRRSGRRACGSATRPRGSHRGLRFFWPAGYWLVPRAERFGTGGTYPGLLAETRGGRVVGFHVRYQAGGD